MMSATMLLKERTLGLLFLLLVLLHVSWTQTIDTNFVDSSRSATHQDLTDAKPVIRKGNNNKPLFTQCSTYAPEVEEEQPRGTFVIQVKAIDNDPPEDGGTISYSIIKRTDASERKHFEINNVTGVVTTYHQFDRDEPDRQKEFYVTVKATDNGRPVLEDLCTFKVTVLDVNDNAPHFDKSSYDAKVSVDLKEGHEVMRVFAYDSDDGDNARLTYSLIPSHGKEFLEYFTIDSNTGVIILNKTLADKLGKEFHFQVQVTDNAPLISNREESTTDVLITVVGSDKKPPSFIKYPTEIIQLPENKTNYGQPIIATIVAVSNIEKKELQFELLKGLTKQTNQDSTFQLNQEKTTAAIILTGQLDYEKVTDYSLTVRATNADALSAIITINIQIQDVNDEIPSFISSVSGSVLENDPPGSEVTHARARDKDGTEPYNKVTYELLNHKDEFEIDEITGKVITKRTLDRETESVYNLDIVARDGAPSALSTNGEHNQAKQTFRVTVEDRNDNPPQFSRSSYTVDNILENIDTNKLVFEIKAEDIDTASLIQYTITKGNVDDAFMIEEKTGRILVNKKLDYEKIKQYNLTVRAFDGIYDDYASVVIHLTNVNDERPIFDDYQTNITIKEETIDDRCITILKARDPDIEDENADQKIVYEVDKPHKSFLKVDKKGCVRLEKPLDRDEPNGSKKYQAFILAHDNNAIIEYQSNVAEIFIYLDDINDNAPFLTTVKTVWNENQDPGDIITLQAKDYDEEINGPPFTYKLSEKADDDIRKKFSIVDDTLKALVEFDREDQKYYNIPIDISDNGVPQQTGTSYIQVIIGDINDNFAEDGESEIFVYDYRSFKNIPIGRVYVNDKDDWDLGDKIFQWSDGGSHPNFHLNTDTGELTMLEGPEEGDYELNFVVTESAEAVPYHKVQAKVVVTVKEIPEEGVIKSGSIRFQGAAIEDFVERNGINSISKKDILQRYIAKVLNTSLANVDVFTVITSPSNSSLVDVRFSAHGSPYYSPEKLNAIVSQGKGQLEMELGVKFVMISISECLQEEVCPVGNSCSNILSIKEEPAVVFTNKTSFVGVQAVVEKSCETECKTPEKICYNGGTLLENSVCECPEGFEGAPNCEILGVGFAGDGWAMYPTFEACDEAEIRLEIRPESEDGLIFYVGPMAAEPEPIVRDFMSLELKGGYPVLLFDYGSGTKQLNVSSKKLSDGNSHKITIKLAKNNSELLVDDCSTSLCQHWGSPIGPNFLLNVNGPLQVGGTKNNLQVLGQLLQWDPKPTSQGFYGCIRNFRFKSYLYNLGQPAEHHKAHPNCNYVMAAAVSFSIDSNFLVAILVCVAILVILLLAVVVHRKKQDAWLEKEMDDIRENIISYEDEGGGEVDTAYDLSVLQNNIDDNMPIKDMYKASEVPDISGFLNNKKNACDKDPTNAPFDDVRYYAYEGDGNSTGSLSSLASCTDDGDLKFNYLSNFGPRFRKLADMYGEPSSDDDSAGVGEESWC